MIWETDWEKVTDTENQRTLELALKELSSTGWEWRKEHIFLFSKGSKHERT